MQQIWCKSEIRGTKLTDMAVCTFEPRLAFAHILIKNVSSSGARDHLTCAIVFTWVWIARTCSEKQLKVLMWVSQIDKPIGKKKALEIKIGSIGARKCLAESNKSKITLVLAKQCIFVFASKVSIYNMFLQWLIL